MERGVLSKSNTKVKKRASTRLKATRKECKMASLESSPKLSVDLMALKKRKVGSRFKKDRRAATLRALPTCHGPFRVIGREIISTPIREHVLEVHTDTGRAVEILNTYGKVAIKTHEKTNCLTEVKITSAEQWLKDGSVNLSGPLEGITISLKDTIDVAGYDSLVEFSKFVGENIGDVKTENGVAPYVKTNIPVTLLSFESSNDFWGRYIRFYNTKCTPNGSTGSEGALLAFGGRIGIGSNFIGSVRCPAHYSGVYLLKCSTCRWMKLGASTSMPGQDGIPSVYSPSARALDDLTVLEMAEAAIRNAGHEMVEIIPPSPYEALKLPSHFLCSDELKFVHSFPRRGETNGRGGDSLWSDFLYDWHAKVVYEYWQVIAKREAYKKRWVEWWEDAKIDFIIAPPNALPDVPCNGMHDAASNGGYTFLLNLNADDMHGLSVGIQIVGRRLEEEKVLAAMKRVEDALGDDKFKLLDFD
ncbi:amidase protein [Trichoderma sp. SZMC 28013]